MAAISGSIPSLRRQIKNVAYNFSDAQIKVREATSNDPWGPSSSLMSEISDMTYNTMAFTEIMQMIWKRLNDSGKNWRHVYKGLVLLDYLVKVGSDKVAQQCRENIYSIQTLKDFQHIEDNKDQGMNVREKAKQLVAMLKDDERLKNERAKALMAKKRFTQNGMGIGSDGTTNHVRRSETYHGEDGEQQLNDFVPARVRRDSELEECRPSSVGEEELQLQIALALSKEEADKEQEALKHDDVRLQMALHESRAELERRNTLSGGESESLMMAAAAASPRKNTSALDDLLSLQPVIGATASSVAHHASDPWMTPRQSSDPWSSHAIPQSSMAPALDPWGAPLGEPIAAHSGSDPWSGGGSLVGNVWSPPLSNDVILSAGSAASDPFEMPPPGYATAISNNALGSDVWGGNNDVLMNNSADQFAAGNNNVTHDVVGRSRQLKTPENFLGENSSLVNLDNLMMSTTSKSVVPGMPPKSLANSSVNNPFAATNGGGPVNPFSSAQQRQTPTINEMRAASQSQVNWVTPANQSNVPFGVQPPLEPTNPFL